MAFRILPFTLATILLLLCIPLVCASPPLNGTSTPTLCVANCPSSIHTRTLWDIIQSCVATLLACTWTAVHPNIPGMNEGIIVVFRRRLGIMILALIAPELMVTWAMMQFLSAWDTAKAFNKVISAQRHQACGNHSDMGESLAAFPIGFLTSDGRNSPHPSIAGLGRDWTTTHGFFAWMGGFMLYCDNKPQAPLTPEELIDFIDKGYVSIPDITKADIEDRSKSNALSKSTAIIQLVWFVVQLVARFTWHPSLPTTLLEIDTMAIVTLACISHFLWWKKPKDVGRPHPVHWNNKENAPPLLHYKKATKFSSTGWHRHLVIFFYALRSLMGTYVTISPSAVQQQRIPSLGGYADDHPHDRNHVITLFVGCFSTIIYGSLHLLGWNCMFQGYTELMIWRVASIVTMAASVPFLLIFGWVILMNFDPDSWLVRFPVAITLFVYITARITLFVLMLLSFQSRYPGIYETIPWTTYFPHF
ncbi:hypothetical protein BDR07DRAFT_1326365 [Suillus spraguei]|nr:hypothetical protein BDR07DRAFT_1326365 [Suillus spraguei]